MPRLVHMVFSASGVTMIMQRPVRARGRGRTSKPTPAAWMSWAKTSPSWSSRTLPTKAAEAPSEARPTAVLAAEPPDTSVAGPRAV